MTADKKAPTGGIARRDEGAFGPNSEIARKLQTYYGSLVSEEVPDRFTQLLAKLESAESSKD